MEIRSFKFLATIIFISYQMNLQSFQDISILEKDLNPMFNNKDPNIIQYLTNEGSEVRVNSKDINRKNPLFGVTLDLTKTFDKNNKELISNLSTEYQGDLENNPKNDFVLESGQFIQIKKHNKELLFDGSFFIYFKQTPNLSDFAIANGISRPKCKIVIT